MMKSSKRRGGGSPAGSPRNGERRRPFRPVNTAASNSSATAPTTKAARVATPARTRSAAKKLETAATELSAFDGIYPRTRMATTENDAAAAKPAVAEPPAEPPAATLAPAKSNDGALAPAEMAKMFGAGPSLNKIVQQKYEEAKNSNADRSDDGLWRENDSKVGEPKKKKAKASRSRRPPPTRDELSAMRKRINASNRAVEYVPVAERRRVVLIAPTTADLANTDRMSHEEWMAIAVYRSDYLMSCKEPSIPSDRIFPGKTKRERKLNRAIWLTVNHHGGTAGQFALIDPHATRDQVQCVKCKAKFTVANRLQCTCLGLIRHKDSCSGMDEEHGCPKCKETWETLAPRLDGGQGGDSAARRRHVSMCRTDDATNEILEAVAAYQVYFPDRAARNRQTRFSSHAVPMKEVKKRHLELDEASRFKKYRKFADGKFCNKVRGYLYIALGYAEKRGQGRREVGRRKEALERMGLPFAK